MLLQRLQPESFWLPILGAGFAVVVPPLRLHAFVLSEDIPAEKLEKAIRQGAGKLLDGIALFDVFRGDALGPDRRSLAYRLRLQAADRNLTDGDIADVRRSVVAATAKLGAELRG